MLILHALFCFEARYSIGAYNTLLLIKKCLHLTDQVLPIQNRSRPLIRSGMLNASFILDCVQETWTVALTLESRPTRASQSTTTSVTTTILSIHPRTLVKSKSRCSRSTNKESTTIWGSRNLKKSSIPSRPSTQASLLWRRTTCRLSEPTAKP